MGAELSESDGHQACQCQYGRLPVSAHAKERSIARALTWKSIGWTQNGDVREKQKQNYTE